MPPPVNVVEYNTKTLKMEFMLLSIQEIYDAHCLCSALKIARYQNFREALRRLIISCRVMEYGTYLLDTSRAVDANANEPRYLLNSTPDHEQEENIKANIKRVLQLWAEIPEAVRMKYGDSEMDIIYARMIILDEVVDQLDGTEVWKVTRSHFLFFQMIGEQTTETGPFTYISRREKWDLMSMKMTALYTDLKSMPLVDEYLARIKQRQYEINDSDDFLAQILKLGSRVCYRKLYARAYVGRRTVLPDEVRQIMVMLRQAINLFMQCRPTFRRTYQNIHTAMRFLENIEKIDDQKQWILQSKDGYDLDIRPRDAGINPVMFYPVAPNPVFEGPDGTTNPLVSMLERVQHSMW